MMQGRKITLAATGATGGVSDGPEPPIRWKHLDSPARRPDCGAPTAAVLMSQLTRARSLRGLLVLGLALVGLTCRDVPPTGPGRIAPTSAALSLAASFAAGAPGVPLAPYRSARVQLFTLPSLVSARDTTFTFVDGDTTSALRVGVTITEPNQRFLVDLTLLDAAGFVVYAARDTVTAFAAGSAAPPDPKLLTLVYIGPDTLARSLAIGPRDSSLAIGAAVRFRAVARQADGTAIPAVVVGFSSRGAGITVDADGTVHATAPVALGGALVIARLATGLSDSTFVAVASPNIPVSLTITPSIVTLGALGELRALAATIRNAVGDVLTLTPAWTSRDPAVASVGSDGGVQARANGSTYIVAAAGSVRDSARITVRQLVDTILLSRDTVTLAFGDTATVVATLLDRNRNAITDITPTFATADGAIASVTAGGRITLLALGTTRLTASAGGRSASVVVRAGSGSTGITASLAYIRVTPGGGSVRMGGTLPLVAEMVDAKGIATVITPAWASDQPGRAPVSSAGLVTFVDTTAVTITATSKGIAGHASFTVLAAPSITSFSFAPTVLTGVTTSIVQFSMSITAADPGAGIATVEAEFTGPGGVTRGCSASAPIVGTLKRGTWDCVISLPIGSPVGLWHFTRASLAGTVSRTLGEAQLSTYGSTILTVAP